MNLSNVQPTVQRQSGQALDFLGRNNYQGIGGYRPASKQPTPGGRNRATTPYYGDHWYDSRRPQTSEFRKDLTEKFQLRLRSLGQQRVYELNEGFNNPGSLTASPRSGMDETDIDIQGSVSDFSTSHRPPTTQLGPRMSLLPRLGSTGLIKGPMSTRSSLSRVSTAPTALQSSLSGKLAGVESLADNSEVSSRRHDGLPSVD